MSFSGSIFPRGVGGAASLGPPGDRVQARGESGGVRATPPEAPTNPKKLHSRGFQILGSAKDYQNS